MISVTSEGSFKNTLHFLEKMESGRIFNNLDGYGRQGVDALSSATPVDTGETAHDWNYQIGNKSGIHAVSWFNTHRNGRVNIAVILQYGHGTGTGGWVEGRDYINPAMKPIFDRAVADVWRQVTNG